MPTFREIGLGIVVTALAGLVFFVSSSIIGLLVALAFGALLIGCRMAWRRWRRPEEVTRNLDEVCRWLITRRAMVEEMARRDSSFVLGPFDLPRYGKGFTAQAMRGPFSVAEARQGFFRFEHLGVIEQTFSDVDRTEYRWTDLGKQVRDKVLSAQSG